MTFGVHFPSNAGYLCKLPMLYTWHTLAGLVPLDDHYFHGTLFSTGLIFLLVVFFNIIVIIYTVELTGVCVGTCEGPTTTTSGRE